MLTSLGKIVGLPAVWQDRQLGLVERAIPNAATRRLSGVIIRRGIGHARWAPADEIALVGERCVLLLRKPEHLPDNRGGALTRAFLTTGECVGEVTDVLLHGDTLRLAALEVSSGPLYRLMGRHAYAADFRVLSQGRRAGEVIVPQLMTWAELERRMGEEGEG